MQTTNLILHYSVFLLLSAKQGVRMNKLFHLIFVAILFQVVLSHHDPRLKFFKSLGDFGEFKKNLIGYGEA